MPNEFISIYDKTPAAKGWYATLHCYDVMEGFFPSSSYWDGEKFTSSLPISNWINKKLNNKDEAERFARESDPNW